MQKFKIFHWLGNRPPHPQAVQEDDSYVMRLTVDGIMALARDYDIMIQDRENERLPFLWLDDKGKKFRKR